MVKFGYKITVTELDTNGDCFTWDYFTEFKDMAFADLKKYKERDDILSVNCRNHKGQEWGF